MLFSIGELLSSANLMKVNSRSLGDSERWSLGPACSCRQFGCWEAVHCVSQIINDLFTVFLSWPVSRSIVGGMDFYHRHYRHRFSRGENCEHSHWLSTLIRALSTKKEEKKLCPFRERGSGLASGRRRMLDGFFFTGYNLTCVGC